MWLHQQLSQGKVGSAHTEHQSLWDVKRVSGTSWACKAGTGMGQSSPEQPCGSSTKAVPLQPWLRHTQLHRSSTVSRETTGRWGTREEKQQLLCWADFTSAFSPLSVARRTQGGWVQGLCRHQAGNEWCSQCDETRCELCSARSSCQSHSAHGSLERSVPEPLPPARAMVANTNPCKKQWSCMSWSLLQGPQAAHTAPHRTSAGCPKDGSKGSSYLSHGGAR